MSQRADNLKNRRIGVLAGGPSSEREISLKSGMAVFSALTKFGINARFIDLKSGPRKVLKHAGIDTAFIALHGGYGEDGTIQALLEDLGIPYTGSGPDSSRLALDKIASKRIFIKNGIPAPEYLTLKKRADDKNTLRKIKLPAVIKPRNEGSSVGLSIVTDDSQFKGALSRAFEYSDTVLVEKFIKGRELTVGILGEGALPVVEIKPKNNVYDYSAKYIDKETEYVAPAELEKNVSLKARKMALRAHMALGCRDISRVDMRLDDEGRIFVLEVNTIPGLTERSLLPMAARAKGIDFGELCYRILEMALEKKGDAWRKPKRDRVKKT